MACIALPWHAVPIMCPRPSRALPSPWHAVALPLLPFNAFRQCHASASLRWHKNVDRMFRNLPCHGLRAACRQPLRSMPATFPQHAGSLCSACRHPCLACALLKMSTEFFGTCPAMGCAHHAGSLCAQYVGSARDAENVDRIC
jgi:hypothetical protein